MKTLFAAMMTIGLLLSTGAVASEVAVDGVFGLAPVPEGAALAVWVPLETEEAVQGIRWYHNDGSVALPELLAVAGSADAPAVLADAVPVAHDLTGPTLGWSEITLEPAIASATPGLFLVFRLPEDAEFTGEGTGAGLGYQAAAGPVRCWVATGDGAWDALGAAYQMAVEPILGSDKSAGVMVLGGSSPQVRSAGEPAETPVAVVPSLRAAPNPFNPQTEIRFAVPRGGQVRLAVYDVRGRQVRTLVSEVLPAGEHAVTWDGRDGAGRVQPSGVYLALLEAGGIRMSRRLTLVQ